MPAVKQTSTEFTNYSGKTLTYRIERLLIEVGVPTNLKGFGYLRQAIEIVYNDPSAINDVLKGMYSSIAKSNNTSVSCVERNIRTALAIMWNGSSYFLQNDAYSEMGIKLRHSPQPREFIALISDKLRRGIAEPHNTVRYSE